MPAFTGLPAHPAPVTLLDFTVFLGLPALLGLLGLLDLSVMLALSASLDLAEPTGLTGLTGLTGFTGFVGLVASCGQSNIHPTRTQTPARRKIDLHRRPVAVPALSRLVGLDLAIARRRRADLLGLLLGVLLQSAKLN